MGGCCSGQPTEPHQSPTHTLHDAEGTPTHESAAAAPPPPISHVDSSYFRARCGVRYKLTCASKGPIDSRDAPIDPCSGEFVCCYAPHWNDTDMDGYYNAPHSDLILHTLTFSEKGRLTSVDKCAIPSGIIRVMWKEERVADAAATVKLTDSVPADDYRSHPSAVVTHSSDNTGITVSTASLSRSGDFLISVGPPLPENIYSATPLRLALYAEWQVAGTPAHAAYRDHYFSHVRSQYNESQARSLDAVYEDMLRRPALTLHPEETDPWALGDYTPKQLPPMGKKLQVVSNVVPGQPRDLSKLQDVTFLLPSKKVEYDDFYQFIANTFKPLNQP